MDIMTTTELLRTVGGARSDAIAITDLLRPSLSHGRLDDLTARLGTELRRLGVGHNERVAISLPNGAEMATVVLAVTRVATASPLNPGLTRSEFEFYLADLDARLVLVAEDDRSEATSAARALGLPVVTVTSVAGAHAGEVTMRMSDGPELTPINATVEPREASRDDVALVLHTSGTTSRPKIVPLTHENLCRSAANVASSLALDPSDRCLNVMPLFHIHGLVAALLASSCAGASVVCTPGFEAPRFFEWFEAARPTWYTAVPTMHQAVLSRAGAAQRDLVARSDLRLVRSSSASLPPSVLTDLEKAFGVPVIEAYGMTEAAHQMTSNPLPPRTRKLGSVGLAAGPEVAIADAHGRILRASEVGEVVIRGSNVMSAYDGIEDQAGHFHADGWFRTGDQGYLDAEGYLFLTGRLKEIINRGGETVAPRAIDEVLLEHPKVAQAVAFAVPDPSLGEEVAAAVVAREGTEISESELQEFLLGRLSWARMPKRILVLDEIPKGATGKVQRIGLAEQLGLESVHKSADELAHGDLDPADETVQRLTALWSDVLDVSDLGADDSFLEVGGDSITATALVIRVENEFSVEVPLMAFFDAATIRRQAALVDQLVQTPSQPDS
jgi:acyl-CoA synthetase (AMP-forming)/AMP-acid ligase II/acyl carrier protein